MSEVHLQPRDSLSACGENERRTQSETAGVQPSFLEKFLNSFFQENNIRWMLVVGAAIVFGSSLMLVTKNWPSWPNTLKYLTIVGYTGVIFGAAEVSRKRLRLNATYKVLHSLTLLLLPVCFLALRWLTSGSATQTWNAVEFCAMLVPAKGFLWFAATRILDHLLRRRQTTFLVAYCLLAVAGALPQFTAPLVAFAFLTICWLVLTAGVIKVNRHTFWLAEEHQWPRIFGFLPIAILGLQFCVLVGTKALSAIPFQWTGFGLVMLAATVLITTRTIADVFRQRTGDLVRPLPWNITIPLLAGLVLAIVGVALAFNGFSYVGPTTYAVIPTSVVASVLMFAAAKDTRHAGFVWIGLICTAIAYQCSPTLFSDLVTTLKQSTADAIHRERVPVSLYGITYMPLLSLLAGISYRLMRIGEHHLSRPVRQFATVVASLLFCVAMTDVVSRFFVSAANIGMFLLFAVAFRDRRYTLPAIASLVLTAAFAIPAMNDMQHDIPNTWTPTVLAMLAVAMTATRLPDRILNTIPADKPATFRHREPETGKLLSPSLLLQTASGHDRNLIQLTGCILAGAMSVHWVVFSASHFATPLTQVSLLQFVLLISAFVVYTVRNPHYLAGFVFWAFTAFAGVRWVAGMYTADLPEMLNIGTYVCTAVSVLCCVWLRWTRHIRPSVTLRDLRHHLGLPSQTADQDFSRNSVDNTSGRVRTALAFIVPLCDLSVVLFSCLVAPVHFMLLSGLHLQTLMNPANAIGALMPSTVIAVLWMAGFAVAARSRIAAFAASVSVPLLATAALTSTALILPSAAVYAAIWAVITGTMFIGTRTAATTRNTATYSVIHKTSEVWLTGLLLISCLSFALPWRVAAAIAIGCFLYVDGRRTSPSRLAFTAVATSIQVFLATAAVAGCQGTIFYVLFWGASPAFVPLMLFVTAISILVFDCPFQKLDSQVCRVWSTILRCQATLLMALAIAGAGMTGSLLLLTGVGFVLVAVAETVQAIRTQREMQVWTATAVCAAAVLFLLNHGIIYLNDGVSSFALLAASVAALGLTSLSSRNRKLEILRRPMLLVGQTLPTFVAGVTFMQELHNPEYSPLNALALMTAAGIYFQQAMVTRQRKFAVAAAVIMNGGLMLLWQALNWTSPEFYLVPVGLSILCFVELLKNDVPRSAHDPLRYIGALTILVSPLFDVLDGSWGHMFTLLVLSVLVILTAIGLRIRALVYTGSAFLLADLTAMVIRSTVDHPSLLWIFGVGLGIAVITLAAFCENHREKLLSRIRSVSAELATWN